MSPEYGTLTVGNVVIGATEDILAPPDEMLLAFFPDDSFLWNDIGIPTMAEADSRIVKDRMDILGYDLPAAHNAVRQWLNDDYLEHLRQELFPAIELEDLRPEALTELVMRSLTTTDIGSNLRSLQVFVPPDYMLRIALEASPDSVVTAVFDEEVKGLLGPLPSPSTSRLERSRTDALFGVPAIVLTEGKTDSEFLHGSFKLLYPHLVDLVRFFEYELRPEGGASALVTTVKAFASAGVANRIIALFDNDTAATEPLQNLDISKLPPNIKVLKYPPVELGRRYPTLGPPSGESGPAVDVNELAGSIELYLGQNVLVQADGTLTPVQWKSFNVRLKRYQGEVTNKAAIHERFRAKLAFAKENGLTEDQDWTGLHLVLDAVLDLLRTN